ncbi:MAG: DUF1800 family protein, partial [Acidobacteriota bacterium]|nr:DUF1800 family protein [Acidobacteriota bacterium]
MRYRRTRSIAVAIVASLVAIGGLASMAGEETEKPRKITIPDTGLSDEQKARHLLNRITYGPRPGDVERVLETGLEDYIEQQLHPELIADTETLERLAAMPTLIMSTHDLMVSYTPPQLLRGIERQLTARMGMDPDAASSFFPELDRDRDGKRDGEAKRRSKSSDSPAARKEAEQAMDMDAMAAGERMRRAMAGPGRMQLEQTQAKLIRAIYSERQLQEVLSDFWFNHFNVYVNKGLVRWSLIAYERDAINPNTLGPFRDLLEATARHPAMLTYLDNWLSAADGTELNGAYMRSYYARAMEKMGKQPYGVALEVMQDRGIDTSRLET